VIDHHCLVWGGPRPEPSLGPRTDNVIIPLDLTQLSCPGFTLAVGLPSGFTSDRVGCWGGALWRACNLTSFSRCLTGPVYYLFASRHKGPRFKSPGGGVLMWNRDSPVSNVSLQSQALPVWKDSRSVFSWRFIPCSNGIRKQLRERQSTVHPLLIFWITTFYPCPS
jgi:hypothetical protein